MTSDEQTLPLTANRKRRKSRQTRNRPVLACDGCRRRHIKCGLGSLEPGSQLPQRCERCEDLDLPCNFERRQEYLDRLHENYMTTHESRFRADPFTHGSLSHIGFSAEPEDTAFTIYERIYPRTQSSASPTKNSDEEWSMFGYDPQPEQSSLSLSPSRYDALKVHLFDPYSPSEPHPSLMAIFVEQLAQMGREWEIPLLAYPKDSSLSLPPLLANSIAALVARYVSSRVEESLGYLHQSAGISWDVAASREYFLMAERIFSDSNRLILCANLDNLYSLIYLSWSARELGYQAEYIKFGSLAIDMMVTLDTTEDSLTVSPTIRTMTWYAVARLENTLVLTTREELRIVFEDSHWAHAVRLHGSVLSSDSLTLQLGRAGNGLLNMRAEAHRLISSAELRPDCVHEPHTKVLEAVLELPSAIHFNRTNMRKYESLGYGSTFVRTHLGLYTFAIFMTYPWIALRSDSSDPSSNQGLDAACMWAEKIIHVCRVAAEENVISLTSQPCLDLYIGSATCALLKDCRYNIEPSKTHDRNRRAHRENLLSECIALLDPIAPISLQIRRIRNFLVRRGSWELFLPVDAYHLGLDAQSKGQLRRQTLAGKSLTDSDHGISDGLASVESVSPHSTVT